MLAVSSSELVSCRQNFSFEGHRFRTVSQPFYQSFRLRGKKTSFFLIRFTLHLSNKDGNMIHDCMCTVLKKHTSACSPLKPLKVFWRQESDGVFEPVGVVGCGCWANRSIPSLSVREECNRSSLSDIFPGSLVCKWLQWQLHESTYNLFYTVACHFEMHMFVTYNSLYIPASYILK